MIISLVCQLIILFFIAACFGWLMEVTLKYIQYHRFINRGFLIGPYCPIYGWGVVAITVLVGGIIGREGTIGETFLAGFVICGILEYFTSWYMEKLFHARWWDYSNKPMNLNGRIWIGNLILFGVASVAIIHWIDPIYFSVIEQMPPFWLYFAAVCIVVLMLADHTVSHILMNIVRKEIDAQDGDNTEEINRRVHELLKNRNLLVRRIHQAYPELQARPRAMMQRLRTARKEFRTASRNVKELLRENIRARKNGIYREIEDTKRLEAARTALRNARNRFSEMQHKLRRHDDDIESHL